MSATVSGKIDHGAIRQSQNKFLMNGGSYELPLELLRAAGVIPREYVYREYPKMLRVTDGHKEKVQRTTETCKGRDITWEEEVLIYEDIIVQSEEEEERVLSGGKTSAQLEDERQGLVQRCHSMGIPADPAWSAVRLRRELGDALDAPAPGNDIARLEAEVAQLRKIETLQAEIAELKAKQAARPDEPAAEAADAGGKKHK